MIPEEQLKEAALEADKILLAAVPEEENCDHEFSPAFEEKMKKLIHRRKHPVLTHPMFRAAAVLVAMLLLGGTLLLSVPEVQAGFKGLFVEEQEHRYRYALTGCVDADDLRTYHLGWVPEGYAVQIENHRDSRGFITYRNPERKAIYFSYGIQRKNEDAERWFSFSSMECRRKDTIVNGRYADLFELRDTGGKISYSVVWMNEEQSVLFFISGARTEAEAVKLAESVISREPEE